MKEYKKWWSIDIKNKNKSKYSGKEIKIKFKRRVVVRKMLFLKKMGMRGERLRGR